MSFGTSEIVIVLLIALPIFGSALLPEMLIALGWRPTPPSRPDGKVAIPWLLIVATTFFLAANVLVLARR